MNELVDSPGLEYTEKRPWRWPTVIFAAIPATFLAFPAALAILAGLVASIMLKPVALLLLLGGTLGWVSMISLWAAARSQGLVSRRTAKGLAAGVAGYLIFFGFKVFGNDLVSAAGVKMIALAMGPMLFSISYLRPYWKHLRQTERKLGGDPPLIEARSAAMGPTDPSTAMAPPAPVAARPFNEERMRRILMLLLIVPAILQLAILPGALKDSYSIDPGLTLLFLIAILFPFYLGIAVMAIWCFLHSRALRGLAVAALVTPILIPFVLGMTANQYGLEATGLLALAVAITVPVLILLFKPKAVAAYLPQAVLSGRGFFINWWGRLQVAMLLFWVVQVFFLIGAVVMDLRWFGALLVGHIVASILVPLPYLALAYIRARTQQGPRTKLRFAHFVSSILLLLVGVIAGAGFLFLLALASIG